MSGCAFPVGLCALWSGTRAPYSFMESVSPEPSPHRTSTFPRIRRSNPAPVWDFRCLYFEIRYDSLLLSVSLSISPVCLDPFALYRHFSCALGGRDATDYYGSAAPAGALATCRPIPCGEASAGSGVARQAISPSASRCLSDILMPGEPGREASPRGYMVFEVP